MSAIGPGDAVVAIRDGFATRTGCVYIVKAIVPLEPGVKCYTCQDDIGPGIHLLNVVVLDSEWHSHCLCGFKPYHGPEQSALGLSRRQPTKEPA